MCEKAISVEPWFLSLVSDQLKSLEICEYAIDNFPCTLASVLYFFKT